jgi:hypothetical protein
MHRRCALPGMAAAAAAVLLAACAALGHAAGPRAGAPAAAAAQDAAARPGARAPDPAPPARAVRDTVVLDAMDDIAGWEAAPASGVEMRLSADAGHDGGGALRIDFDFRGGGGWAAFRRVLPVRLPENYEISFWIRGDAPENTLEFKLIDASGENVWWVHRPRFTFAGDWRQVTFRRRHLEFAWGPLGGGEIRDVAAIEFAITAGTGGSGTVWIDRITLVPREPVRPYDLVPAAHASSDAAGAAAVLDGDTASAWRPAAGAQVLTLDFLRTREYGGVILHWDGRRRAADYDVDVSADGTAWQTVRQVRGGAGPRDYLFLPETESRFLRLRLLRAAADRYALRRLMVQPIEWGASRNALFESMAADAPRGHYPKYFGRVQSYWTLVGVNGGADEALINEEGAVEVGQGAFSIEPFLHADGRLHTWADAAISQSLLDGYLPVPGVQWAAGDLHLDVSAWADGSPEAAVLWLRYRVQNRGAAAAAPTLYLALRPFQVNPSWQFLNRPGGAATVRTIEYDGAVVTGEGRTVVPVTPPAAFGAATFDAGGIVSWLAGDSLPAAQRVSDPSGHASAALAYPLHLDAGAAAEVVLAVPFPAGNGARRRDGAAAGRPPATAAAATVPPPGHADAAALAAASLERTVARWRRELHRFDVSLPAGAPPLGDMLRSNLAWVLINRDGPAIQPGSRSYQRSWIRDGSLTSAALLRLGQHDVVRDFIEWYAPFQYETGKVPCCVDHRGADPVPEHDSHGQLIFLIAEYHRFTGDTALVQRTWPHVEGAVRYIEWLRAQRMTPEYLEPPLLPYYGLVPESISHEGYAAKPMHSYWDNFFVLRGLLDAAYLAGVLGSDEEQRRLDGLAREFRRDLVASFERAMAMHGIDYLPGSVELGDFDATSTTVGITPGGELQNLPRGAVDATFERYWDHFVTRRDGTREWHDYTPYELRVVGTFIHLGQRRRAHDALDWFLRDVRPRAWNHWAEVVWRDPAAPRFIGDMPHGWVGSDFIRSATDMFAYHRVADDALVLAAGILPEWLDGSDPVEVRGLRTPFGTIGYRVSRAGARVTFEFTEVPALPPGGIAIESPLERAPRSADADGRPALINDGVVRLEAWPGRLVLHY